MRKHKIKLALGLVYRPNAMDFGEGKEGGGGGGVVVERA